VNDELGIFREYLRTRGEAAFRALVERYIPIVYAAAKRQTGDVHLAEDVTQAVFVILAQKARTVPTDRPLSAWLETVPKRGSEISSSHLCSPFHAAFR
jgi:DNA-directed RNA polymerase specialized sigma24 family protein